MLNIALEYRKLNIATSFIITVLLIFTFIVLQIPLAYSQSLADSGDNDVELAFYYSVSHVVELTHIIIGLEELTQEEENRIRAKRDLGEDERVLDVIDVNITMKKVLSLPITTEERERLYIAYKVLFQNRVPELPYAIDD